MTGALDALHGPAGFAAATSQDTGQWDRALARIGQPFAIADMTFKNHGFCAHIFAALDAVGDPQREHGFGAEDVEAVSVGGYRATKEVCDRPHAMTERGCRLSMQYTIATLLQFGGVRLAAFAPERLADPATRALMTRVSVHIDPDCAAAFPAQHSARVEVRLTEGRVLARHQPTRKGDPDAPLSDQGLSDKFMELTADSIGAPAARALLDALWHGSTLPGAVPRAGERAWRALHG